MLCAQYVHSDARGGGSKGYNSVPDPSPSPARGVSRGRGGGGVKRVSVWGVFLNSLIHSEHVEYTRRRLQTRSPFTMSDYKTVLMSL